MSKNSNNNTDRFDTRTVPAVPHFDNPSTSSRPQSDSPADRTANARNDRSGDSIRDHAAGRVAVPFSEDSNPGLDGVPDPANAPGPEAQSPIPGVNPAVPDNHETLAEPDRHEKRAENAKLRDPKYDFLVPGSDTSDVTESVNVLQAQIDALRGVQVVLREETSGDVTELAVRTIDDTIEWITSMLPPA